MPEPEYKTVDSFDRELGAIAGLPDVTHCKPTTIEIVTPLTGEARTFIIQTYRQEEQGDKVFLKYATGDKLVRIVLPAKVLNCIQRQRDSLGRQIRRTHGKRIAAERRA